MTAMKAKKDMTLLQAMEHIVELSYNSKLSKEFFRLAKKEIKLLADSYGITESQAVLFSVCMEKGPRNVDYNDLADYLDINKIKMLSYATDIDALVRRHLLKYRNIKDEDDFDIPTAVIRCLKHNEVYQLPNCKDLNCAELFELLDTWFDDLNNGAISSRGLTEEVKTLIEDNPQVGFVRQIQSLHLFDDDLLLLVLFCHLLINEDDDDIRFRQMEDIFESPARFNVTKAKLRTGEHRLMKLKLIEHLCVDGLADVTRYKLTDNAKQTLLAEMKLTATEEKLSDMMDPSQLAQKQLFFTSDVQRQVDELGSFLQTDNFRRIQERMKFKGFRNGFACLFYGNPGTGKTETVYQLARKTGRSIMMVDVPQLKSMWVGQSEKNVKALFDRYREQVKRAKLTPILLFNEADAIIGVRKNGAENAVDKMENSLQNIILQEMEQLDGIMIATTNLQQNMDKAFERRFLYKIYFEKPTAEVRAHIWHEMIPDLDDKIVQTLSAKYDFSGGQIENIARRHAIDSILHGAADNVMESLTLHCDSEMQSGKDQRRIGF
jgi:DNA replication protein DnaC